RPGRGIPAGRERQPLLRLSGRLPAVRLVPAARIMSATSVVPAAIRTVPTTAVVPAALIVRAARLRPRGVPVQGRRSHRGGETATAAQLLVQGGAGPDRVGGSGLPAICENVRTKPPEERVGRRQGRHIRVGATRILGPRGDDA